LSEERRGIVLARLAVDVAPVVGFKIERDERFDDLSGSSLEELVEQAFSRDRMNARCLRQDAVEVEQCGLVVSW
jgi:hypothetical protein